MPIRVLEKSVCEQIAAGEVVERPASVVKELAENAIDAGATSVEIELRRSGLELIRVSDNGCGIARGEVRTAFLRHATSKISTAADLEAIATLGFRGEALAAICAVARVRLVTKRRDDELATAYGIEGGEETELTETGAPDGTTLYVRDLFYNTPARMKFLKKDVHEGNAVQDVVEQQALAHPEVAFRLLRDGRTAFSSPGTGDLRAAVYSVFPREAADNLVELIYDTDSAAVRGFVTRPGYARASRGYQFVFVNGRFVKSRGICAAAEEACRGLVMAGKYPCFALELTVPYGDVDINVHPAKTEVRFRSERAVTSAVYAAVKSAVTGAAVQGTAQRAQEPLLTPDKTPVRAAVLPREGNSTSFAAPTADTGRAGRKSESFLDFWPQTDEMQPLPGSRGAVLAQPGAMSAKMPEAPPADGEETAASGAFYRQTGGVPQPEPFIPQQTALEEKQTPITVLGELFDTYIVAQYGDKALFVDKHAAHERLLFEQIKGEDIEKLRQVLLEPVVITLPAAEKTALLENGALLEGLGFVVEDFGGREVCARELPTYFPLAAAADAIEKIADRLCSLSEDLTTEEREWLIHSVACRAAIKAGSSTTRYELQQLCEQIMRADVPKFCPHGRPVYFTMDKKEFEKRFGRI
ncbi:MAG: DNA mismatch repair endonuclease MutL [Oscillospiraceae bacterium]|nr:DNA mismatch repair endonuclease MutL [Oscillospiraceae bacterium]